AMEDALGLANALEASSNDIPASLAAFEAEGRPRKQRLMVAGKLSYEWYERFPQKLDMPILDFILDFMDRTGRMPRNRLRRFAPNLAEAVEAREASRQREV
ncbi:MAG: monooxygenase, partial [Gemmatimonadetes bacterium]|nr:monooxygenase [Gemmatimonadota bacterium]